MDILYGYMYVHMNTCAHEQPQRHWILYGGGVTENYELSSVGGDKQTQVLCESNMNSQSPWIWAISLAPQTTL